MTGIEKAQYKAFSTHSYTAKYNQKSPVNHYVSRGFSCDKI
jgi:hypothetical protein